VEGPVNKNVLFDKVRDLTGDADVDDRSGAFVDQLVPDIPPSRGWKYAKREDKQSSNQIFCCRGTLLSVVKVNKTTNSPGRAKAVLCF
jgi:hypothetical protein